MKTKHAHIFVDDGFPEASDYDNNFVSYDPSISGSCERALVEAEKHIPVPRKQDIISAGLAIPPSVF